MCCRLSTVQVPMLGARDVTIARASLMQDWADKTTIELMRNDLSSAHPVALGIELSQQCNNNQPIQVLECAIALHP